MKIFRPLCRGLVTVLVSVILCSAVQGTAAGVKRCTAETGHADPHMSYKIQRDTASYILRYYNNRIPPATAGKYAESIMEASSRYSIDPSLITAIIIKESTGKANARSRYAVGLMQVYWKINRKAITAQFPHIRSEKALMEPSNNIMVGTWLFSRYLARAGGDERRALKRYLGSNSDRYAGRVMKYRNHFLAKAHKSMTAVRSSSVS